MYLSINNVGVFQVIPFGDKSGRTSRFWLKKNLMGFDKQVDKNKNYFNLFFLGIWKFGLYVR